MGNVISGAEVLQAGHDRAADARDCETGERRHVPDHRVAIGIWLGATAMTANTRQSMEHLTTVHINGADI